MDFWVLSLLSYSFVWLKNNFGTGIINYIYLLNSDKFLSLYWVIVTRQHKGYANSENQLFQQLESASNKEREKVDWINQILNISGLIALILVCASDYLTITNKDGNIPEHLKTSVLTILGFYFGGLVKSKKNLLSNT